ncbi:MAG TPA: hypothetical protein VIA18_09995 [Polyangia bacterium]|nr:hypothetical protein [Polyangia bacterium]
MKLLVLVATLAFVAGCHDFDALSWRYGVVDLGADMAGPSDLALSGNRDLSPPLDLASSDMTLVGHVSGGGVPTASVVDLTAAGALDWAHWGYANTDKTTIDRKATSASQISDFTTVNGGSATYANNPDGYSWTDGSPTPSVTSTTTGVFVAGAGAGFQLTVPASTVPRTLVVYVGGYRSNGKLTAALSDHSAPDYSDAGFQDFVDNIYGATYTLTFNAASAGQLLTITWTAASVVQDGNVSLQAAALE